MLTITNITRQSLGKVVQYYADGADDYYAKDGTAMQWDGAGASSLGLNGEVSQERFRELLDGRIDDKTKIKRNNPGGAYKERLGYDLTFSAPKGVSLQALVHGDQRIVEAHDKAVRAAIREAERLAMARKTENKKTAIEHTNSLVVAKFRHETSRALDPDLHTHAFVLNMTQREDGEWRALMNDAIHNSTLHLGNVYKAELARELQNAGFVLRFNNKNGTFDLAHFTDHQIREFSERSRQIEEALAQKGLDRETASQAEKNLAALATRDRKDKSVDREEVRREWQNRARELGIDFGRREWAMPEAGKGQGSGSGPGAGSAGPEGQGDYTALERSSTPPPQIEQPLQFHIDKVVDFAIKSLTERNSIVTQDELVAVALPHGFGLVTFDDVITGIENRVKAGHLIVEEPRYRSVADGVKKTPAEKSGKVKSNPVMLTKSEWIDNLVKSGKPREAAIHLVEKGIRIGRLKSVGPRYTTHIAQRRERDILLMERAGRGTIESRVQPEQVKAFFAERGLKPEQEQAVSRIVQTPHRFMGVQGWAGVGKSFMTAAARDLLEEHGYKVTSLAPYGSQVKSLQADGIEARTVQSFLKARDKKIDADSVVFIDEAGVIPARQMRELMKVISNAGARAVFLGDMDQTKAIEAGKPFEQLMKAGMETSKLQDIQRQKDPTLLEAVKLAAMGKTTESVGLISSVKEVEDASNRYDAIVQRYASLSPSERAQTLIITGTNESRHEINAGVRRALELEGKGLSKDLLNRLDTTQAERQHSKYYTIGSFILPEQDYKNGLQRGQLYTVIDNGPGNRLTVENETGERLSFSPARCSKLSVYELDRTELALGDQVKITRNNAELDVANGDRFTVQSVTAESVVLEGAGRTIELTGKAVSFVALAYASTVHSAQGLTCDKVLLNLETQSRTTAKDVYYVAISRARHLVEIFTDSSDMLAAAIGRMNGKSAALEIKHLQRHAVDKPMKEHQMHGGVGVAEKRMKEKQVAGGVTADKKQRDRSFDWTDKRP